MLRQVPSHERYSRVVTRTAIPGDSPEAITLPRCAVVALGFSAATAIAVFIVLAPWPIGFSVAIACATGWCVWLQRHPD